MGHSRSERPSPDEQKTIRQVGILTYAGYSQAEIAERLGIQEWEVGKFMRELRRQIRGENAA